MVQVVALRIELSELWLSAGAGQPASDYRICEQLVRESNPPLRLERAESCADRRTSRMCLRSVSAVGREALESSSAVLQTAATPSQLSTQKEKAGRHRVTPGLARSLP